MNRDRLEHSRTSAAARRPDPTGMVLDRVHSTVQDSPNRDRLEHSRTSAVARRPDPTEMVLDRIHGAVQDSPNRDRLGGGGSGKCR